MAVFSLSDLPPLFHLLYVLFMGVGIGGTIMWLSMQPPPGGSPWFALMGLLFLLHLTEVPNAVRRIRTQGLLGMKQDKLRQGRYYRDL
ncbi:hypothetical protein CQJ94_12865 [Glycomyces fuscus]|nr:hypothetical protein CQJ94_12865 [Glycomyces fuscus]